MTVPAHSARRRTGVLWALVVLSAALPRSGGAGPVGLRALLVTAYTDNLFQSHTERGDWIQQVSFDLDTARPGMAAYYTGQMNLYSEYEDLYTQSHTIGLSTSRSGSDRRLLTGDLSATLRAGRSAYDYRDYVELDGWLAGRTYLQRSLMLRAGAGLRRRDYRHAQGFSYLEPSAYAQLSRFLPTRTTVMLGLDAGLKRYLGEASDDSTAIYVRTWDDDAQALVSLWGRVAQSLGPRTGLQLQYTRQSLWAGAPRYRRPEEYDPVGELFDDGYSHSGHEVRATLKHRGLAGVDATLVAHWNRRTYEGRPALDLEGLPIADDDVRRDRRTGLRVRLDRRLSPRQLPALRGVTLRLEGSLLETSSNDPYYTTSVRVVSLSLELDL